MNETIPVCIVTPYLPSLSETFIRAHIERLPASVTLVHGWQPMVGGRHVLTLGKRVIHKILRVVSGTPLQREVTSAYLTVFRRVHAQAVLAEYGNTGITTIDACRRLRIPLIVHFHGYDASIRSVLEAHAAEYARLFRAAAAIVAVSGDMQRRLVSLGAPAEIVHHVPYGVDCRRFEGADPSSAPPALLAVGRFVEKKAPQATIRAFAEVHRAHSEARLRMIGDGPLLAECRDLVRQLGLEEAVTLLGPQPHEVVSAEMRSARGFAQHSVEAPNGDREGTPVAILEASATGLPVISTRHAGIPEVVLHEKTGLLVDENDVRGMAMCMTRVISDPMFAGELGRAGRERVMSEFSMERSLDRLWSIITSCIDGARRNGVGD